MKRTVQDRRGLTKALRLFLQGWCFFYSTGLPTKYDTSETTVRNLYRLLPYILYLYNSRDYKLIPFLGKSLIMPL